VFNISEFLQIFIIFGFSSKKLNSEISFGSSGLGIEKISSKLKLL